MNMKNIAVMEVEFGAAENTHFYNFLLNGITYHTLMIWFCKIKRLAEAEEIFDQIEI
jgi:pentatricopeptide repeat protein